MSLRSTAAFLARQTVGRWPRSSSRLTGSLAINGGAPVRDIRLRPWPSQAPNTAWQWLTAVGPALREVYLSGAEGLPQTRQVAFAARWAEYCGCRHALLLPHGTDALRFALAATLDHDGLDYGGEVIVPNLSFIATATAPLDRRFGVALVDVEEGTLNLDPRRAEEAIVPGRTRAIMPVHQFGQPADMTAINEIARRHGLMVIEDAAQAHGAVWGGRRVGGLGHAAGFSFQSAKNLSAGEGGILTTDDRDIFARAHALHNAGRSPELGARWEHHTLGWNCRPTEYQAALLAHRLGRFDHEQSIRSAAFAALQSAFADSECLRPLAVAPGVGRHGMYMFVVRYRPEGCGGASIEEFVRALQAEGAPVHRGYAATIAAQPVMRDLMARRPEYVRALPTPVSDQAAREILYIPGSALLAGVPGVEDIVQAVRKVQSALSTTGAGVRS